MARLIRLWKPHGVLSQFTSPEGRPTLKSLLHVADVYPAGRLDLDSEGLLLLTDSGALQARIARPGSGLAKCYQVQVEGQPAPATMGHLRQGVVLKDGPARALAARIIEAPDLPARDPAPRPRPGRGSCWLEIELDEGRNRQVRRMCAAVGYPVLRLVRVRIGPWSLAGLQPGSWRAETLHAPVSPRAASRPPRPRDRPPGTRSSARRPDKSRASRTRRGS
ncbi:MAG: pseudouridine synthase [Gammaproteobacteria bacterium]|nr:MAG: pseudouridine synthase [Gammaproteobacteria bacterium]